MPAKKTKKKSQRFPIFGSRNTDFFISLVISTIFMLVVLTFPSFFFINPFNALTPWLVIEQLFSMVGWIFFIFVIPVVQFFRERFGFLKGLAFVSWVIWPAALILIHLSLLVTTGNAFLGYLVTYPIFFFTDLIAPVIYLFMWLNHRRSAK